MVTKKKSKIEKKPVKKVAVKAKAPLKVKETVEEEGGMSLDDAFGDDEDVTYAPSKPRKEKKKRISSGSLSPPATRSSTGKKGMSEDELEEELDELESVKEVREDASGSVTVTITASKPVAQLQKGSKVVIDGQEYTVDAHYVLIDHGSTQEMAIELYDAKDGDFQLRYFSDQIETTLELYQLAEIMYLKRAMKTISW